MNFTPSRGTDAEGSAGRRLVAVRQRGTSDTAVQHCWLSVCTLHAGERHEQRTVARHTSQLFCKLPVPFVALRARHGVPAPTSMARVHTVAPRHRTRIARSAATDGTTKYETDTRAAAAQRLPPVHICPGAARGAKTESPRRTRSVATPSWAPSTSSRDRTRSAGRCSPRLLELSKRSAMLVV